MVFEVLVDDVLYRASSESLNIQQQAGASSTSNIDIEVTGTPPRALSSCQILIDSVPEFWGIIQSVESPQFNGGKEVRLYRLTIQSGECIFNNRLVSEAYVNKTTTEIVQHLFDNYIEMEGLTLGAISVGTDNTYENFNQSFGVLSSILQELADDVGASFYVSADKKFYFVTRDTFELITAPAHITALKKDESAGDIRTVQIVSGASEETSTQNEGIYWAAGQVSWTLGYQVGSVSGFAIAGTPVGFGILGLDEGDTSKTFLYNTGSNIVTLNSNATVKPTTGQLVGVVYKGYYDIIVTNYNDSLKAELQSINGTSGLIEKILTDTTIDNFADADQKANGLLKQYGEREQTLSCECKELEDSALFKMWEFNLPDLNIVGQYVVTERSISSFGSNVWIRLKLKNKNFFAKYGTVFVKRVKERNKETKVYKTSNISDSVNAVDLFSVNSAGLTYYPTSGAFSDPMLDGFYPGV